MNTLNAPTPQMVVFLALAVFSLFFSGCESDKTEPVRQASISVSPTQAEVGPNESVEFVATGWPDFVWSLREPSLGTLSNLTGERTRYTRIGGSNTVQVLTVRPGHTNTNGLNIATQIAIRHR